MPKFSQRSLKNLQTANKQLQDLMNEVIKGYDCSILWGYRGEQEQDKAFEQGFSKLKYPNSKHNQYPSNAVDVAPYPLDWDKRKDFYYMAGYILGTAHLMGINVKWGGSFNSFADLPHIQLE